MFKSMSIHQKYSKRIVKSNFVISCLTFRDLIPTTTLIPWTLVRRSLVETDILLERVHTHHCLRVHSFHYVFSMRLICWYSKYAQVKKNKRISACVYTYNVFLHWVCVWLLRFTFIDFICWWEFVYKLFEPFSHCVHLVIYFLVQEMSDLLWGDSKSLSHPSFHSLMMWLSSMF